MLPWAYDENGWPSGFGDGRINGLGEKYQQKWLRYDNLTEGENTIAVHTFYQGLVNRVWQSGDLRHGLLCDVEVDGKVVLSSDTSFLVCTHSAYSEVGTCGYDTQILERYDSGAREVVIPDSI